MIFLLIFVSFIWCQPPPPVWDEVFQFIAAVNNTASMQYASMIYSYNYDLLAVSQVMASPAGQVFTILNVQNNTWRVDVNEKTCCLCTNPSACAHVPPPNPHWLQSPDTKYVGVSDINGRKCEGWVRTEDVAEFGWWTSVDAGQPCQLAWMLGEVINFPMSLYVNNRSLIPDSLFDVPSYCPNHETDPNCSISGF